MLNKQQIIDHLMSHDHSADVQKPPIDRYVQTTQKESRQGTRISMIVIHYTMSRNVEGAIDQFVNGRYEKGRHIRTSAHYVVTQQGKLVQVVDDSDAAWHAGNRSVNLKSIGIEHCANPTDKITDAQSAASLLLIRWLMATYGIKAENVVPHDAIHPTDCPAKLLSAYSADHKEAVADWLASDEATV